MSNKGLFIDMDGTLMDNLTPMFQIYQKFLLQNNKNPTETEFDLLNGIPLKEGIAHLKNIHRLDGSVDELHNNYQFLLKDLYLDIRPSTGAEILLKKAKELSIKTALVTSATTKQASTCLQTTGLSSFFDYVIGSDSVDKGKPHPEPYQTAMNKLNCSAHVSIAIEDSVIGSQSAVAAGLRTFILLNRSNKLRTDWPPKVEPINSLLDVVKFL